MVEMRKVFFPLVATVVLGCFLTACDDDNKKDQDSSANPASSGQVKASQATPKTAPPQTAEPAPKAEDDPEQAIKAKLSLYIKCFNDTSSSFESSLDRYSGWVKNMEAGPTGRETPYVLYAVSSEHIGECTLGVDKAGKMPPAMPELESAAAEYVAAIVPLGKTITEAHIYYERENYKDDKFAKGKELHKPLLQQSKVFKAAAQKFFNELDRANDQVSEARLKKMEKDGDRNLGYLHLSVMIQSKQMLRLMEKASFPIDEATAKVDTLQKTADELQATPEKKPILWSMYTGKLDDYLKAARARLRRVRDNGPDDPKERQRPLLMGFVDDSPPGSASKLVSAYNALVNESNTLSKF